MNILVFGKTGQVATELQRHNGVLAIGRDVVDLCNPEQAANFILSSNADAVINAAAYTDVDKAETDEALANVINGAAPKAMAKAAAKKGIPFVHISTDYVFDGQGAIPRLPEDTPAPLGAYGRSKLIGEIGVQEAGGVFAILRTSWVFSAQGRNFVKTMLRLGKERDQLSIVADQIGGPTSASDIADTCLKIAKHLISNPEHKGIYHYCGAPNVSWADFAREIFTQSTLSSKITDITSLEYPTPALRPANSRMDCTLVSDTFGISQPDWRKSLAHVLQELRECDE